MVATSLSAALLACAGACAGPTHHTPEPWASDATAAAALETRAAEYCAALYPLPDQQPTRPFVTDGCSSFFDREWDLDCCVTHDIAYWCGGTREQRRQADKEFGECVSANAGAPVGQSMRFGVRFGGHPFFPTSYRWGYGHDYRAFYPSTEAQEREP